MKLYIKQWFSALLSFLLKVFVLFLLTMVVVTGICWYWHWWSFPQYGTVLSWAGVALMGLGAMSLIGRHETRASMGDPAFHMARAASSINMVEWIQQEQSDSLASFRFTFLTGMTGLLVLVVGYVVMMWPGM